MESKLFQQLYIFFSSITLKGQGGFDKCQTLKTSLKRKVFILKNGNIYLREQAGEGGSLGTKNSNDLHLSEGRYEGNHCQADMIKNFQ